MYATPYIYNLFAITIDFLTGMIGWSSSTGTADISGGLDNLLLETGDHFLLESAVDDVLLLE